MASWLSYTTSAGDEIGWGFGNTINTSDHSNIVSDRNGHIYVYRGLNEKGYILKFDTQGNLLWRLRINSTTNKILSPFGLLVKVPTYATGEVITLPNLTPTTRSYTPPKFATGVTYAMNGRSVRRVFASGVGQAGLTLTYENITDNHAYDFLTCFDACYGSVRPVMLPENALGGMSSSLQGILASASRYTTWRWAQPPRIDSVSVGRSTVSVTLSATEQEEESFYLSLWGGSDYLTVTRGNAEEHYLIRFTSRGSILFANRYTGGKAFIFFSYNPISDKLVAVSPADSSSISGSRVISISKQDGAIESQATITSLSPGMPFNLLYGATIQTDGCPVLYGENAIIRFNSSNTAVDASAYYTSSDAAARAKFRQGTGYDGTNIKLILKKQSQANQPAVYYGVNSALTITQAKSFPTEAVQMETSAGGVLCIGSRDQLADSSVYNKANTFFVTQLNWETGQCQRVTSIKDAPYGWVYPDLTNSKLYIAPSNNGLQSQAPSISYRYSYIGQTPLVLPGTAFTLQTPNPPNAKITASSVASPDVSLTSASTSDLTKSSLGVNISTAASVSLLGPMPAVFSYQSETYTTISYSN